jgi:antitoxin component of RelBE/YafQ-DinJ toxin-antitoxin module
MSSNKIAIYAKIPDHLKQRFMHQCKRLNLSQAAALSMSLVKFLEEEEKKEAINSQR